MATSAVQMNGSMVGGSAITSNFKTSKWEYLGVLGEDVMGVDVSGLDFMALIPWENVSEQGRERKDLLSPTIFNIYIERIMSDALEEHDGKVSISSRNIINLQFAKDLDAIAGEEQEHETLVESLNKTRTRRSVLRASN